MLLRALQDRGMGSAEAGRGGFETLLLVGSTENCWLEEYWHLRTPSLVPDLGKVRPAVAKTFVVTPLQFLPYALLLLIWELCFGSHNWPLSPHPVCSSLLAPPLFSVLSQCGLGGPGKWKITLQGGQLADEDFQKIKELGNPGNLMLVFVSEV